MILRDGLLGANDYPEGMPVMQPPPKPYEPPPCVGEAYMVHRAKLVDAGFITRPEAVEAVKAWRKEQAKRKALPAKAEEIPDAEILSIRPPKLALPPAEEEQEVPF